MLRKLRKRIKGQSTAEYAILIALVIAAVIAMQTFTKRLLSAKIKDAGVYMVSQIQDADNSASFGNTLQYEPYYLATSFDTTRDTEQTTFLIGNQEAGAGSNSTATITRFGSQDLNYDDTAGIGTGINTE